MIENSDKNPVAYIIKGMGKPGYRFKSALRANGLSVIAEIKRRSPSAGVLKADLDVAKLARDYRDGGAACLSVLTDKDHFGGSPEDLQQARRASGLPVLRKDFLTDFKDMEESRAMGADAVLLIVADIDPAKLRPLHETALRLQLDVLTEIRDPTEFEAAVKAGAYMIAVNQRSRPKSRRFSLDDGKALKMSSLFAGHDGIVKVAASGIGLARGSHPRELAAAGYEAILVGESLLTAADPTAELRALLKAA